MSQEIKQRIVQELVPGKQITLAHLIANPDTILYEKLGIELLDNQKKSAIGVLTVTPAETVIIIGDIALKAAGVTLGLINIENGSLVIAGTVSQVEAGIEAICDYAQQKLKYDICDITKT